MKNFWKILFRIIKYFLLIYFGSSILFVVLYRFVNPPVTPLMVIRVAEQFTAGQPVIMKKSWAPLDKIAPSMELAVIAAEDNKFTEHWGFDFEAINKAKAYNEKKKGKKVRGASTISQQTAKNVFLWPQRSWIRKGLEVYFTSLIEIVWGKKRIMEVYLNVIETGDGIYGVNEASEVYYHKPASGLSRSQAALIAAILPNPRKWNPASPTSYLINRQQWILWNMGNIGRVEY